MYFLQNLPKNPQEKLKILIMTELATKKIRTEPELVPRLAGWLHSCMNPTIHILIIHELTKVFL